MTSPTDFRFSPPVRIETIPNKRIETIPEAVSFLRRRDGESDPFRDAVLAQLEAARTPDELQAAADAFLAWLDAEGLVSDQRLPERLIQ